MKKVESLVVRKDSMLAANSAEKWVEKRVA